MSNEPCPDQPDKRLGYPPHIEYKAVSWPAPQPSDAGRSYRPAARPVKVIQHHYHAPVYQQFFQQANYWQPVPMRQPMPVQRSSGTSATIGFVLGVLGFVTFGLLSVSGLGLSIYAYRKAVNAPGEPDRRLAITGLTLSAQSGIVFGFCWLGLWLVRPA